MAKAPFVSAREFETLFESVKNWGRWGAHDQRGTLNYIGADKVREAASLVRTGRAISLAIPINTVAGPDNPHPAVRHMVRSHDVPVPEGEPRFATDWLGSECHGDCHTHVDGLCHVSWRGKLYNGVPAQTVTSRGPSTLDVTAFEHGVVGRGVLLDLPRLRGVPYLEPGEAVTVAELEAAEIAQGVRVGEGDILLFRTGHHRRRLERGGWDNGYGGEGKAGVVPAAVAWMHERKVAAFLPDGDGETVPSNVEGIAYPIHILQLVAMGMLCADSLQFEELVPLCEQEHRWIFLVTAAPLRLPGATGTLFNPLAIL